MMDITELHAKLECYPHHTAARDAVKDIEDSILKAESEIRHIEDAQAQNAAENARKAAKAMVADLGATPREIFNAIQAALTAGTLTTEERQRPSRNGTYDVLVLPPENDPEEIPF